MAASEFYDHTTYPSNGAAGSSAAMRAELDAIEAGFGKLPDLAGNANKPVRVNAAGTALEAVSALPATVISNTPSGNISATTVQAAIDELDTEKLDKSGGTITGNLAVNGNTTLGDAAGDSVTVNGATWTFSGTATRIQGDFSNATVASRVMFQTSNTSSPTDIGVMPSGAAGRATLNLYSVSDPNNAHVFVISSIYNSDMRLAASYTGTPSAGTYLPMTFHTGGSETLRLTTDKRIQGDFSNATVANRVMFQTSTVNGNTSVDAIPNGTAVGSDFIAYNSSDPANAGLAVMAMNTTNMAIQATKLGTGTYLPMTFYTGGSERMRIDTSGNATFTGGVTLAALNAGQLAGFRNKIINGAMKVDQRNAGASQTFTAGAALAYCVDRWYGYCTGANITGQRIALANAQNRYRFTGAASNTGVGFGQRIEAANSMDLAGLTATLSVKLSSSSLTSITWTVFYANTTDNFGTLASPTRTQIATGAFTINSTEATYSANIAVPAAATTGIEIVFTGGALLGSQTLTIGDVQLEVGSVATPFEHRPYGAELALCQRYFYRIGGVANGFPLINGFASASGQNPTNSISFPVEMRATPTATVIGSWQTANCTGPTVSFTSQHGAALRVLATTGPAECSAFPNSADDVITFAIEL